MKQRKRYGRRTHLLLSAALLVLCVLLCLPACSDMILNPDGSISRPGTMTLDNGTGVPDPTGTGSTAGDMTLTPATGSATSGSMIWIRPTIPMPARRIGCTWISSALARQIASFCAWMTGSF